MSFEFEYEINGRKVSKAEWLRHIVEEAQAAEANALKTSLSRLRCAQHGQAPRLVVGRKVATG